MLIDTEQPPSSPPSRPSVDREPDNGLNDIAHSATFNFPVLTPEGSVHHHHPQLPNTDSLGAPRLRLKTPPAALSSLAAKMAMASSDLSKSVSSLTDSHYDMLDDVSETSIDDHETASLASTPQGSDGEEANTILEDTGSIVDLMEEYQHSDEWQQSKGEHVVRSFISEDLDTPRQSIMHDESLLPSRHPSSTHAQPGPNPSVKDQVLESYQENSIHQETAFLRRAKYIVSSVILVCFTIAQLGQLGAFLPMDYLPMNRNAQLAARKESLSTALNIFTNSSNSSDKFNMEHLLPSITGSPTGNLSVSVHHQGASPNFLVVSFLKEPGGRGFPRANATKVYRPNGKALEFNLTKLIDGVYGVTIPQDDAHGTIWVNMLVNNPHMNATVWHDFGRRQFKINIPDTVSLAKVASKELALVHEATKSWKHKLAHKFGVPLNAGVIATMNITTELATYMRRDLQVFGNTALSVLAKAARETNNTMASLRKDFILVQKDVVLWKDHVQKSLSTTAGTIKALVPTKNGVAKSLARSRSRALRLRRSLVTSKSAAEKLASTKKAVVSASENIVHLAKKWQKDRKTRRSSKAQKDHTGLSVPYKDTKLPSTENRKPNPSGDSKKEKLSQKLKHKRRLREAQKSERNSATVDRRATRNHDKMAKCTMR